MNAPGPIAATPEERDELVKSWLRRLIDERPLAQAPALPLSWIAERGPELIEHIEGRLASAQGLATAGSASALESRAALSLVSEPGTPTAPRELAALQGVLVEALSRRLSGGGPAVIGAAASHLALIFGELAEDALAGDPPAGRPAEGGLSDVEELDALTGLPGRASLDRRLGSLIEAARRAGEGFALALVDLENLATINSAFGHGAGDRSLASLAAILERCIGASAELFRLDGSEFGVLGAHISTGELLELVARVARLLSEAQSDDSPRLRIASGIVGFPEDGSSPASLVERAIEATYAAKAAGVVAAVAEPREAGLQDP